MKIREYLSSDKEIIKNLKVDWRKTLTAPEDGMWATIRENAKHWIFTIDKDPIGFAVINQNNELLNIFISRKNDRDSSNLVSELINKLKLKNALLCTNNPLALTAILPIVRNTGLHSLLFVDVQKNTINALPKNLCPAINTDSMELVDYYHECTKAPKSWLMDYIQELIKKNEIYILKDANTIIGTCEVRKSLIDHEIADIGMTVSPNYRRLGYGTKLLSYAKSISYSLNRQPICSTEISNTASIKAIIKNGFICTNQILKLNL